jgi:hypothetical protein
MIGVSTQPSMTRENVGSFAILELLKGKEEIGEKKERGEDLCARVRRAWFHN